ncbi:MAG TPA: spore coat protein, partial [Bacillota bacterium]|nr:spore coat protein [Bacillota bacterium]
ATITTKSGAKKIGKQLSGVMQQPKDVTVNDRDRLNGVLMHEKQILLGYSIGLNEVFDPTLFNIVQANRNRVQEMHQQAVEALFNMGEYTADIAPPEQVRDAYDVFNGYKNQLPYPNKPTH